MNREAEEHFLRLSRKIADWLKDRMKANGLTVKLMAAQFGVSPRTVVRWRSGTYNYRLSLLVMLELKFGEELLDRNIIRRIKHSQK